MSPRPRPAGVHRVFGLSIHLYVHPGWCATVCTGVGPSKDQDLVKIFVQGRISRPINGSKLIFHMRLHLYETSRNIQAPWPHDLYFMVHWLWTLARLPKWRFWSTVESQDLRMVARSYFTWGCKSMYTRAMTYIDLYFTSDPIYVYWVQDFTVCWLQTLADFPWLRFSSSVDSLALLMEASWSFTRGFISVRPAASAFMPRFMLGGESGGQYLEHHRFCHISKTSWWMNIILGILVQCDTNTDLILCMQVSDLYFMVQWFCLIFKTF